MLLSRRQLLRAAATATTTSLGVALYTWQWEPHWLEIVRRDLPIRGLPQALVGKGLAQLSDIHVGMRVADDYLLDTFQQVAASVPDNVVYTGDFTSHHEAIDAHADRLYGSAPRGRLATLGVLGNHDYGPNWAHAEVAARIAAIVERHGIRVLRNAIADVEGLQIVGLDDLWAERFDAPAALATLQQA